jgi:hypothetical protein
LAIVQLIARLHTVAVQTVVAQGVIRHVVARIRALVARVVRAAHTVVAVDGRAGLAVPVGVTGLRSVAVDGVVTRRIAQAVAGRTRTTAVDPIFTLVLDAIGAGGIAAGAHHGQVALIEVDRFTVAFRQTG